MVPQAHHCSCCERGGEHAGHAHREASAPTARPAGRTSSSPRRLRRGRSSLVLSPETAAVTFFTTPAGSPFMLIAEVTGRAPWNSGDERHDADGHFGDHRAVRHRAHRRFPRDEFGVCPVAIRALESGNGAAGHGDKHKGEERPGTTKPLPWTNAVNLGMSGCAARSRRPRPSG